MGYYTDDDRKRAAAKRKYNSMVRQLSNSPEDAYDILGVSVPRVKHPPTLSEYGLDENIDLKLEFADKEYIQTESERRRTNAWTFTIIVILLLIVAFILGDQASIPGSDLYIPQSDTVFSIIYCILIIGGFVGFLYFWSSISEVKPLETLEHKKFKEYQLQLSYYDYWQRRKSKDHWNHMSGDAFEKAIANLFRNIGFDAEVTPRGGDGGVDIILRKGQRKIAVQCKRYKSAVGPHIIRDLWGTMIHLGFNEGCIVTTTGFTKGVTSFAEDKDIILIDLNDILKSIADDGEKYLKSLMGEAQ